MRSDHIFHVDAGTQSAESAECTGVDTWRPFPTELLPVEVATYVRAQAQAIGCDEAMVAPHTLVVLAAGIGNSAVIQLKNSWREPSTLWAALISPSGTQKSPALQAALAPVILLEHEYRTRYEFAVAEYEEEHTQSRRSGEAAPTPTAPVQQRIRVSDATLESVGLIHSENPRGLLLGRDELAGWVGSFDKYSRGDSDLQGWIELYDGRPLQIDRKTGKPRSIHIPNPSVCVAGTVQPRVMARQLSDKHIASGFLARMLVLYPPERRRQWTDADITRVVDQGYADVVRALYARQHSTPAILGLHGGALQVFTRFYNLHADLTQALPDGSLRSAYSKLEAITARLALVLTLAENPTMMDGAVSQNAMERAVGLVRWFRYETRRVYAMLEQHGLHIGRDGQLATSLPDEFTWKDVSGTWGVERRAAFGVIGRLIDRGLIAQKSHGIYSKCTALSAP